MGGEKWGLAGGECVTQGCRDRAGRGRGGRQLTLMVDAGMGGERMVRGFGFFFFF